MNKECYFNASSIKRSECEKVYKKGVKLGKGAYATVYEACIDNDCSYVLKVIKYEHQKYQYIGTDRLSRKYIMKQWKMELLSHLRVLNCEKRYQVFNLDQKLAPWLYDAWFCDEKNGDTIFYIVMEKYDGNLSDFIKKYKKNDLTKNMVRLLLSNLLSSLYFIHNNCNICLNDIKLDNILYKRRDDGYFNFVFGDFGLSSTTTNQKCKDEDQHRFKNMVSLFIDQL